MAVVTSIVRSPYKRAHPLQAEYFGGVPPVALAYVTDIFAPNERPRYLSGVQATISVSFVAGSVMGGALARFALLSPSAATEIRRSRGTPVSFWYQHACSVLEGHANHPKWPLLVQTRDY